VLAGCCCTCAATTSNAQDAFTPDTKQDAADSTPSGNPEPKWVHGNPPDATPAPTDQLKQVLTTKRKLFTEAFARLLNHLVG
jgi:hypothetical protein